MIDNNEIILHHFRIFRTDIGSIEKHTLHVNVDNMMPKREPRPGESLFKLRAELGKKIKENREKLIAQRLQEEKEQELTSKQMESEDDEEEFDLSDDEKACTEPEEQMEQPVDENMESENDMEDSDDDESENADLEIDVNTTQKPRKRILALMDEDSDNENPTDCNIRTFNLYLFANSSSIFQVQKLRMKMFHNQSKITQHNYHLKRNQ